MTFLNPHEVYLKLGETLLEESLNHNGSNKTICIDQAMVQFLLALGCDYISSKDKTLIQTKMQTIFGGCSENMKSEVIITIFGQPKPSITPPMPPTMAPPNDPPIHVPMASTIAPPKDPTMAPPKDPTLAPPKDPTMAPPKDPTMAPTMAPPNTPPSPVPMASTMASSVAPPKAPLLASSMSQTRTPPIPQTMASPFTLPIPSPTAPSLAPPTAPPIASKMNEDVEKVRQSVEACKVTTFQEIPWDKVILRPSVRKTIWNDIIIPLKNHRMKLPGILPGHLIFGCSSTGKSSLVNAIMTACKEDNVQYFKVNCAELFSPWMGLSPKIIKELFRQAHHSGPALIVFDEADALFRYNIQAKIINIILMKFIAFFSENALLMTAML